MTTLDDPVLGGDDATPSLAGDDIYGAAAMDWDEHEGSLGGLSTIADESDFDEPLPVGYDNGGWDDGATLSVASAPMMDVGMMDAGVMDAGVMDAGFDPGMDVGVMDAGVDMAVDPSVGMIDF
jgi:hypothetical protein